MPLERKNYYVVDTDNFGGDYPDEKFLSFMDEHGVARRVNFHKKEHAEEVAKVLNSIVPDEYKTRYNKVVESGYTLSGGFEP